MFEQPKVLPSLVSSQARVLRRDKRLGEHHTMSFRLVSSVV